MCPYLFFSHLLTYCISLMGNQIATSTSLQNSADTHVANSNNTISSTHTTRANSRSGEFKPDDSASKIAKKVAVEHKPDESSGQQTVCGGIIEDSPQVQLWRRALMDIRLRNVLIPPEGVKHFCFAPDEKLDYTRLVRALRPEVDSWYKVCVPAELSRNEFWRNLFFNLQCLLEEMEGTVSKTDTQKDCVSARKQELSSTAVTSANSDTTSKCELSTNDALVELINKQRHELEKVRRIVLERTWLACKWCQYTARAIDIVEDVESLVMLHEVALHNPTQTEKIIFESCSSSTKEYTSGNKEDKDVHVCGQHTGTWSLSQDAKDFIALGDTLKKQLRDQKKRRLEEVETQLAWIPDNDNESSMSGKWTCCDQERYQSQGCLKKENHDWEITNTTLK